MHSNTHISSKEKRILKLLRKKASTFEEIYTVTGGNKVQTANMINTLEKSKLVSSKWKKENISHLNRVHYSKLYYGISETYPNISSIVPLLTTPLQLCTIKNPTVTCKRM